MKFNIFKKNIKIFIKNFKLKFFFFLNFFFFFFFFFFSFSFYTLKELLKMVFISIFFTIFKRTKIMFIDKINL